MDLDHGVEGTEATQMAYAGNASDLAKQPAPSSSSRDSGSWQPLLTAVVVVAILIVVAMATAFIANSNRVNGITTIDRGADRIEMVVPTIDRGADLNETVGVAPADNSLTNAERMPSDLSKQVYKSGVPVDPRYDTIENLRGNLR
jgi:hypothetical protein